MGTTKYWTTVYVEFKGEPQDKIGLLKSISVGIMRLCNINRKITHVDIIDSGKMPDIKKLCKKVETTTKEKAGRKYKEEYKLWNLKTPSSKG